MSNRSSFSTSRGLGIAIFVLGYGIYAKSFGYIIAGIVLCIPLFFWVKDDVECYRHKRSLIEKYKEYVICSDLYGWLLNIFSFSPKVEYILFELEGKMYLQVYVDDYGFIPREFDKDEIGPENVGKIAENIAGEKCLEYEFRERRDFYDAMDIQIHKNGNKD